MTLKVNVQHEFAQFALDVAFEAPHGVTVLYGASGSGKTTIVNAVAGLLKPQTGRIELEGRLLLDTELKNFMPPYQRRIGYVFQESRLLPHLSVRQNLLYGSRFARKSSRRSEYTQVLEMLGLNELTTRRPRHLSGGEKQRVAIGRALLANPELIVADEPLANLDEARKGEILPYLERLRDELEVPMLYVSHAAAEVARLATTVVAIEEGRVIAAGPASEVLANPMVTPAGVRAAGALLEATVVAHHDDGLSELDARGSALYLPKIPHSIGSSVRIRIAAQDVLLSREKPAGLSALNILHGTIESVRSGDGPGALLSIVTPAGQLLARVTRRSVNALSLAEGVACYAIVKTVAIAPQDIGGTSPF